MTSEETFDLVMGELNEDGCLVTVLVVGEGLSRKQAVVALEVERSIQLDLEGRVKLPGRASPVTECDGDSFELLDPRGQSYRRYFLERTA